MVGSWGLEPQTSTVSKEAGLIDGYRSLPHRIDLFHLVEIHQDSSIVGKTRARYNFRYTYLSSRVTELGAANHPQPIFFLRRSRNRRGE
jgi:hypothetical protein